METTFEFVVFGAVAFSILMCLFFLFSRENVHDEIGSGGFGSEGKLTAPAPGTGVDALAGRAERELEVRQMLGARSERLVRSGQPALDIDAEVARLLGPSQPEALEPGIAEEVRQLVVARNERRVRQGLEPLEVEAEVARTLEEFDR